MSESNDERRIHQEMAKVLRDAGWIVTSPPDTLTAGPWSKPCRLGMRDRKWEGTNSMAAHASPQPCRNPPVKQPKHYDWWARLFKAGKYDRRQGRELTMGTRMDAADKALLELLTRAREQRVNGKPWPSSVEEKTGSISLPPYYGEEG